MSRGKDKSLVNVKRKNTGAGCKKKKNKNKKKNCAHGMHGLARKAPPILERKTQCDLSDALVLRSSALFKPTETIIVDPPRGKAATGPV